MMTDKEKQELMEEFMPWVREQAERFASEDMPEEDLVQEGYIGLIEGIRSLDEEAFAWSGLSVTETLHLSVQRAMEDAGRRYGSQYRDDSRLVAQVELLSESIERLTEELGTKPNIDEIANDMGLTQDTVLSIMKLLGEEMDDEALRRGAENRGDA